MREIGGYIELDLFRGSMLHEKAIHLNCGRNALAYLIEAKKIKKILLPYFLCSSVKAVCENYKLAIRHYRIDEKFHPIIENLDSEEWLYLVNYYGQISDVEIKGYKEKYKKVIVDNSQAYFEMPLSGTDTLYTCRKYFGVSDGAILYTDRRIERELPNDESFERIHYILGRFERDAGEFYLESAQNNDSFSTEPIKLMSRLTNNLLHGVDYERVKKRRTDNFNFLYEKFKRMNELNLFVPKAAFMYPLLIKNGRAIRKKLQDKKIYIPTLWPDVIDSCPDNTLEYRYAEDILPLPVDQRYNIDDMQYLREVLLQCIN